MINAPTEQEFRECTSCENEIEKCDCPCTYGCDEGYMWGNELGDPLWYDDDELYPCPSCNGTGLARRMTLW